MIQLQEKTPAIKYFPVKNKHSLVALDENKLLKPCKKHDRYWHPCQTPSACCERTLKGPEILGKAFQEIHLIPMETQEPGTAS